MRLLIQISATNKINRAISFLPKFLKGDVWSLCYSSPSSAFSPSIPIPVIVLVCLKFNGRYWLLQLLDTLPL